MELCTNKVLEEARIHVKSWLISGEKVPCNDPRVRVESLPVSEAEFPRALGVV